MIFSGLVPHLVVYLDLVFSHLDVFLHDAHFLGFFRPLEAKVHLIICLTFLNIFSRSSNLGLPVDLLFLFEVVLVHHLVCLEINFVLLVELHRECSDTGDIAEQTRV